jgi:hypothetical protein
LADILSANPLDLKNVFGDYSVMEIDKLFLVGNNIPLILIMTTILKGQLAVHADKILSCNWV